MDSEQRDSNTADIKLKELYQELQKEKGLVAQLS